MPAARGGAAPVLGFVVVKDKTPGRRWSFRPGPTPSGSSASAPSAAAEAAEPAPPAAIDLASA